jgi:uncharacterized lipoprotein YbaY
MKKFLLLVLLNAMLAGCAHLDTSAPGADDRVLTGVVTSGAGGGALPPDSEVTIRIVDLSGADGRGETLGEATIENPGAMPVAFRIEYRAEDATLMRDVNVEARISVGGRLSYMSMGGHPITLSNVNDSHVIQVMPTAER